MGIKKTSNYKSMNIEELKEELNSMKRALMLEKVGFFFSLIANINTTPSFIEDIKNYIINRTNFSLEEEIFSIMSILSFLMVTYTYGKCNRQKGVIETLIEFKSKENEVTRKKTL